MHSGMIRCSELPLEDSPRQKLPLVLRCSKQERHRDLESSHQGARRSQPAEYQKRCESLFEYISINLLLFRLEFLSRLVDLDAMEVESFVDFDARCNDVFQRIKKAGLYNLSCCLLLLDITKIEIKKFLLFIPWLKNTSDTNLG